MATWCVYCRKQIPDDASLCPICGKPLTDGSKVVQCASCGSMMLKNAAACPKCGAAPSKKRPAATGKPVKQASKVMDDDDDDEDEPRRWAGIIALILGVVGFLTGFIGVGIFFDIVAIIFGLIAIISKRQKSSLGIAGLCVAAVSLLTITIFASALSSIFGGSEKVKPSTASTEHSTVENSEKTESNEADYQISDTGFYYYTNSIGTVEYRAYVEITNTGNTNLYLADCTFDLEDNDGHLLQTDSFISSCPDVIAPGEKGYFYNGIGASSISEGVSLDNGFKLSPNVTVKVSTSAPVIYKVSDTDLRPGTFDYPTVTGRVTNNTETDESLLYVQVIFYDAGGKVLEITGTNLTNFEAGKTLSFEISGVGLGEKTTMDSIASYQVVARASHYQF